MKELESMLAETNSRLDSLTDAVARVETSNDASNSAPSGVLPDCWEAAVTMIMLKTNHAHVQQSWFVDEIEEHDAVEYEYRINELVRASGTEAGGENDENIPSSPGR
ncbi:hypothetical protein HDU77_001214, partial [Chytriomyces hyalinus]